MDNTKSKINKQETIKKYGDIINLNRPKSKHPKMGLIERSAQFAPFAALVGYGDEVKSASIEFQEKEEFK